MVRPPCCTTYVFATAGRRHWPTHVLPVKLRTQTMLYRQYRMRQVTTQCLVCTMTLARVLLARATGLGCSVPSRPKMYHHNALVERANAYRVDGTRIALVQAGLPPCLVIGRQPLHCVNQYRRPVSERIQLSEHDQMVCEGWLCN